MRTRKTHQTELVMQAVNALDHPTANNVLDAVHELDPAVSRATVFRVLAEAAESGEGQRLVLAGSSDCFDITLGKHAWCAASAVQSATWTYRIPRQSRAVP